MNPLSRRSFMGLLGTGALSALAGWRPDWSVPEFRIRTITAGVELQSAADLDAVRAAREFLSLASSRFSDSFEVQTTRIATQPLPHYASSWMSTSALQSIRELDRLAADADIMFNIGPVLTEDGDVPGFASWAADLAASTTNTSFSTRSATCGRALPRDRGIRLVRISHGIHRTRRPSAPVG
jgi:hypothetical protein